MQDLWSKGRRVSLAWTVAVAAGASLAAGAQPAKAPPAKASTPATPSQTRPTTAAAGDDAVATDAAIQALEARVKQDTADPVLPTRLGSALLGRAKVTRDYRLYVRADAALDEAIKRDPRNVAAMVLRGSSRLAQHRFGEALDDAEKALKLRPDAPDAIGLRGDARLQLADFAGAREDYESLFSAGPDLLAHVRMANLQWAEGDAAAAAKSMEAAVKAGQEAAVAPPLQASALVRLGELRFRTGDWEQAERDYGLAKETWPNDPDLLDHLAELHAARGEFEAALKFSDQALAKAPRPEFQQARGDILAGMQRLDDSLACYEKALAAYLEAAQAGQAYYYHHLAGLYCDVEALYDPAEAARWARRDLQIRRTSNAFDALGWALYHDGKFKDAADAMDRALRDPIADAHVLYHAGLVYSRAGDTKKGRLYLRRAAAANPKFNELHFHR